MNNQSIATIVLVGIGLIVAGAYIAFRRIKSNPYGFLPSESVDTLTMETVIAFFKDPKIAEKLRSNENLIAVAIKKDVKREEYPVSCIVCCFDKKTNSIVESAAKLFYAKKYGEDLQKQFAEEDMIVLM